MFIHCMLQRSVFPNLLGLRIGWLVTWSAVCCLFLCLFARFSSIANYAEFKHMRSPTIAASKQCTCMFPKNRQFCSWFHFMVPLLSSCSHPAFLFPIQICREQPDSLTGVAPTKTVTQDIWLEELMKCLGSTCKSLGLTQHTLISEIFTDYL